MLPFVYNFDLFTHSLHQTLLNYLHGGIYVVQVHIGGTYFTRPITIYTIINTAFFRCGAHLRYVVAFYPPDSTPVTRPELKAVRPRPAVRPILSCRCQSDSFSLRWVGRLPACHLQSGRQASLAWQLAMAAWQGRAAQGTALWVWQTARARTGRPTDRRSKEGRMHVSPSGSGWTGTVGSSEPLSLHF